MRKSSITILVTATLLGGAAHAHLLPVGMGTINVVGQRAYIALSLPVSAFAEVPSCADGVLSLAELASDGEALRGAVRRALRVEAGGEAELDQILVDLPVGYGHDADRSAELTVLVVARLPTAAAPELSWTRWSARVPRLALKATVSQGRETLRREFAVITPAQPAHRFFVAASPPPLAVGATPSAGRAAP